MLLTFLYIFHKIKMVLEQYFLKGTFYIEELMNFDSYFKKLYTISEVENN